MPSYMHNDNALTYCIHRAYLVSLSCIMDCSFDSSIFAFCSSRGCRWKILFCVSRDRVQAGASLFFPPKPSPREKRRVSIRDGIICATDFVIPKKPSLLATNINFLTSSLQACLTASRDHVLFTSNCSGRSGVEKEWKKKDT